MHAAAVTAAVDNSIWLPPPPDKPPVATTAKQDPAAVLPAPPVAPPPLPASLQLPSIDAARPAATQAPKFATFAHAYGPGKRVVVVKKAIRKQAVDSPSAGANPSIVDITQDDPPQEQGLPLPPPRLSEQQAAATHPAVTEAKAVAGVAASPDAHAIAPTNAPVSKPSQSFDGKQSFISLEVDEPPINGAAPVDQPSPAAGLKDSQSVVDRQQKSPQSVHTAQAAHELSQAQPMDLDVKPSSQPETQMQAATAAAAAAAAAADEADKREIRPDLFAAASKERPLSAASQGLSAAKLSEADTGQKLLAASKSKTAAKGNIQIVLATKHKQVFFWCTALSCASGCIWSFFIQSQDATPKAPLCDLRVCRSTCVYHNHDIITSCHIDSCFMVIQVS